MEQPYSFFEKSRLEAAAEPAPVTHQVPERKPFKPYMVFKIITYYPAGGPSGFLKSFETLEEARAWVEEQIRERKCDWFEAEIVFYNGEDFEYPD